MKIEQKSIVGIPAIIIGEGSDTAYLFVHGKMGSKDEATAFARFACPAGCQVVGIDLLEHGSRKENLHFMLDRLSDLTEISYRCAFGEYMIHYRGKVAAYLCDDRLLVKPVPSAVRMMPEACYEPPYEGAKDMLLVDNVDDREFLAALFTAMYLELPEPKKK